MQSIEQQLKAKLAARLHQHYLRTLPETDFSVTNNQLLDFSSNDYLGLARNAELTAKIANEYSGLNPLNGATGSRLISGNTTYCEDLERFIAAFHKAEAALIFNSGYQANLGLCSCIGSPDDTILYDELCHASIRDGLRLSRAKTVAFRHNDLTDLKEKTERASGNVFIIVESVYSMDGDIAPLNEMVELFGNNPGIAIIVDEAHGFGVFGKNGEGLVQLLGLEKAIFARVITYGKAAGGHGAAVVGPDFLKSYLINYSNSFIYTTALPLHALIAIKMSYEMLITHDFSTDIQAKINLFLNHLHPITRDFFTASKSPVQSLVIQGNSRIKAIATALNQEGFGVKAILFPTVPKGKERIRISLHLFNQDAEIIDLAELINQYLAKM